MAKTSKPETTASPPATRASKRKASESLQSATSSVIESRPSSSGSFQEVPSGNASQLANSRDSSEDEEDQRTTHGKKRKLDYSGTSVHSSIMEHRQSSSSTGPPSLPLSRASEPTPPREINGRTVASISASDYDGTPSYSDYQNKNAVPALSPDDEPTYSQLAESPENFESQNADTPENVETPENLDEAAEENDGSPEIQPVRRGRPPNRGRGRGRGRGGRGGRGGLTRANSGVMSKGTPTPSTRGGYRGRGGRGKKYSSNRLVQAAFDRQKDLKSAYRQVSKAVREALILITDKNLEFMKDDVKAHEKQPEFRRVLHQLDQRYNRRMIGREHQNNWERRKAENKLKTNKEYTREVYKVSHFSFFICI